MTCPRCDGLLIEDRDDVEGHGVKCANCGGVMPKFVWEEHRQRWLEGQRKAREARMNGTAKKKVDFPVNGKPKTTSGGIAGAIEEIESKITALEQVKRNLLHAQELVNL